MQEILDIVTNDLGDEELDYEVVDLGTSDLYGETVDLGSGDLHYDCFEIESGDLENISISMDMLVNVERRVQELESQGNVRYDIEQNLTIQQAQQAKNNIKAGGGGSGIEIDPNFTYWLENDYVEDIALTVQEIHDLLR